MIHDLFLLVVKKPGFIREIPRYLQHYKENYGNWLQVNKQYFEGLLRQEITIKGGSETGRSPGARVPSGYHPPPEYGNYVNIWEKAAPRDWEADRQHFNRLMQEVENDPRYKEFEKELDLYVF